MRTPSITVACTTAGIVSLLASLLSAYSDHITVHDDEGEEDQEEEDREEVAR